MSEVVQQPQPVAQESAPVVAALELRDVVRTFRQANETLEVLRGISFSIAPGEMVALVGPSGAGKSTLLHICGLLERPDEGEVLIEGRSTAKLSDEKRTAVRGKTLGFVYQYHHLLPEFSALENVVLPQMILGMNRASAKVRAGKLLAALGLSDREKHRPARLSGGEQQRVAVARALANAPSILLTDEPTGNLDHQTAGNVFKQLTQLVHGTGIAALVATHNLELASQMDRILTLEEGKIVES